MKDDIIFLFIVIVYYYYFFLHWIDTNKFCLFVCLEFINEMIMIDKLNFKENKASKTIN